MSTMETTHRPASQKLPAGLAGVLNPDDHRDSAYFSSTDASNTSAASIGVHMLNAGAGYPSSSSTDKTPSPIAAAGLIPQPLVSPATSNMSVASMVSPTTPASSVDPRRFDTSRPLSLESGVQVQQHGIEPESQSRRESVDSRMNQGFSDMRLGNGGAGNNGASSPYGHTHANHSSSSIQNTLSTQRNPRPGHDSLSLHRISNGYQPSAERNPPVEAQHPKIGKTAPAITGPATSTIARAAEPTKGQAWAFPEEEIQRIGPNTSFLDSRRSSITDSIASSQFTSESRLPPGQRRLDDANEFNRLSSVSAEFASGGHHLHHHHSLQHKQLDDLQSEEVGGQSGSQPYSRTPELRVSHKLAERKRRTEMKELFEQLRDMMPQERGSKASKWEILTKAINEHQRQNETIRVLQSHYSSATGENEILRREINNLRMEVASLRGPSSQQAAPQGPPPPPPHQQGPPVAPPSGPAFSDPFSGSRTELPPLRSLGAGPDSMTGVQYDAAPRVNGGYRDARY